MGLFPGVAWISLQVSSIISASSSIVFLQFYLGVLLKVCPCGGSQLSDRGILRSLLCTSGFSYACLHTSPPIIIRNILGDKKNPCLTPEITGTRDDGFSFMHNLTNKSIRG